MGLLTEVPLLPLTEVPLLPLTEVSLLLLTEVSLLLPTDVMGWPMEVTEVLLAPVRRLRCILSRNTLSILPNDY